MSTRIAESRLYRLVEAELKRARDKFPEPLYTFTASTEEHGELARAILHACATNEPTRERRDDVLVEAAQAIAMLVRVVVEGDESLGLGPTLVDEADDR